MDMAVQQVVHPHHRSDPNEYRVQHAKEGYQNHPEKMPPLLLVHRHGVYQVADGHHRAMGAKMAGAKVNAYVAYSPHENEDFGDSENPRAPFYGAQPTGPVGP